MKKIIILAVLLLISANCFAIPQYYKKIIDSQFERNKNEQVFSFLIDRVDDTNYRIIEQYIKTTALKYKFKVADISETSKGIISITLTKRR